MGKRSVLKLFCYKEQKWIWTCLVVHGKQAKISITEHRIMDEKSRASKYKFVGFQNGHFSPFGMPLSQNDWQA